MRQAGGREDRQLLAAHKRVQAVNGGYARLNEFRRIVARRGIDRRAIDVKALIGNNGRSAVDRRSHAVEHASQNIARNGKLGAVSQKTHLTVRKVDAGGAFEQLHERVVAVDFQYLTAAHRAVRQFDFAELVILDALDLFDEH